jgi:hypothetical protein
MDPQHTPPAEASLQAGHETSDVHPRGVLMLAGALIVVAIVVHLLLWWLFQRLEARASQADPPVSPLARQAGRAPGPDLELKLNYGDFEAADRSQLESYGWADREQRVVHIPIERAMQLLAQRGLPEPAGPVQPPAAAKEPTP